MENKKKTTMIAAFVVLGVAMVGLAVTVYAKYFSSVTSGNGSLTVAKWAFDTDNANSGTLNCPLDETYDTDTLVSGKIAPGTSGTCELSISNANSEVGVAYEIKPSTISGAPTNMLFYKDAGHNNAFSAASTITGTLTPGESAQTVKIYWVWPYETPANSDSGDTDDTTDGKAAGTMTASFDITGTQVLPAVQP